MWLLLHTTAASSRRLQIGDHFLGPRRAGRSALGHPVMQLAWVWVVPTAVAHPVRHGCEPPAWCGVDFSELALEDADGTAPPFRVSPTGHRRDALHILRAHGAGVFRMRLWNEPCADGRCDPAKFAYANLTNVLRMARRVQAANLKFVLDLHYSDWWADPHNQRKPMAWKGLSALELREAVFQWTRRTVAAFVAQGTTPLAVQVRGSGMEQGIQAPPVHLGQSFVDGEGMKPRRFTVAQGMGMAPVAVRVSGNSFVDGERNEGRFLRGRVLWNGEGWHSLGFR